MSILSSFQCHQRSLHCWMLALKGESCPLSACPDPHLFRVTVIFLSELQCRLSMSREIMKLSRQGFWLPCGGLQPMKTGHSTPDVWFTHHTKSRKITVFRNIFCEAIRRGTHHVEHHAEVIGASCRGAKVGGMMAKTSV